MIRGFEAGGCFSVLQGNDSPDRFSNFGTEWRAQAGGGLDTKCLLNMIPGFEAGGCFSVLQVHDSPDPFSNFGTEW